LICRHCHQEWRAQEIEPEEFRSGRLVGRGGTTDSGTRILSDDLPPQAGSSSVAIDMSWAGRELGRYRVLSLLGQGGMGTVWRSHDDALRRDVALKILSRSKSNGGELGGLNAELFLQEARAVAKLQHPSVVSIYEVAEDKGQIFLALELMEGGTLKEFVEKHGRVPPRELFRMMVGPVRALALAHKRGIIHRDIKPGNLMFDEHHNLKLMDFGLAEVADETASEKMKGKAVGSLGWIAPETARGQGTTAASDIYAMGLVLLYALTGKPRFQSKSRAQLIAMHQTPPPLDLRGIKGLTPSGEDLLRRCVAVEQADRFLTADFLAEALQRCADEDRELLSRERKKFVKIAAAAGLIGAVIATSMVVYIFTGLINREKEYRKPVLTDERRATPLQYQPIQPGESGRPEASAGEGQPAGALPSSSQPAAGGAKPGDPQNVAPAPAPAARPSG
jgi:serine/threonine protein kinase